MWREADGSPLFSETDRIDLTTFKVEASETFSSVENAHNNSGMLTIKDGALKASITLFGEHIVGGFHLAASGAGAAITYAVPVSVHVEIAGGNV